MSLTHGGDGALNSLSAPFPRGRQLAAIKVVAGKLLRHYYHDDDSGYALLCPVRGDEEKALDRLIASSVRAKDNAVQKAEEKQPAVSKGAWGHRSVRVG